MLVEMQTEENEMKHLCEELDGFLDDFFQTLKKLLTMRQELDKTMKEGFFLMARARYSMGARSVTSTQYNTDDLRKAFSHVDMVTSSDGFIHFQPEIVISKSRTPATGQLIKTKEVGLTDGNDSECVELDHIGHGVSDAYGESKLEVQSGLRRRNLEKTEKSSLMTNDVSPLEDVISGVACMTCDEKNEYTNLLDTPVQSLTSEITTEHGKDPLLWFGVLVPQPLRQSQTSFRSAIELLCQIATLQNHLIQVKALYEEKMGRKHELLAILCKKCLAVDGSKNDQYDLSENSMNTSGECPDFEEITSERN